MSFFSCCLQSCDRSPLERDHSPRTCNWTCQKTLFTVALVIGVILLLFGALALAGHFAPLEGTGALQQFQSALNFVAESMGTDPFLLAIFTASFGAAFTFVGTVGVIVE